MVIDISDLRLRKNEPQTDREAIEAIIDVVALPEITKMIRAAGLNPFQFVVNEQAMGTFLSKPITETEEDGALGSIYYDCKTEHALYRAECRIAIEKDQVESETAIYMLKDYLNGNREWRWYNGNEWVEGPGKDFFDISEWTVNGNA